MKETVLQSFLLSMPEAAAIWALMLVVAAIAAAALWLPGREKTPDRPDELDLDPSADPSNPLAWRDWAHRYADEITVAAERAAATARRRRAEWQAAQEEAERMWVAFEAAEQVARRSAAAAAFAVPEDASSDDELSVGIFSGRHVDRERYLHRAATAACRRRELTIGALNDILAHRDGWDPRRHPAVQEAALHRAVRERWRSAYRDAAVRERQAWDCAEGAAAALSSLREEACTARLRAGLRHPMGRMWWAGEPAAEVTPPSEATQPLPTVEPALSASTVTLPIVTPTRPVHPLDGRVWNGAVRIPVPAGAVEVTRSR